MIDLVKDKRIVKIRKALRKDWEARKDRKMYVWYVIVSQDK